MPLQKHESPFTPSEQRQISRKSCVNLGLLDTRTGGPVSGAQVLDALLDSPAFERRGVTLRKGARI